MTSATSPNYGDIRRGAGGRGGCKLANPGVAAHLGPVKAFYCPQHRSRNYLLASATLALVTESTATAHDL